MKNIILFAFLFQLLSCIEAKVDKVAVDTSPEDNSPTNIEEPELKDGITFGHRIFVTSSRHSGNLGGISGANTICQNLAEQAGLTRNYKALLGRVGLVPLNNISDNGGALFVFTSSTEKVKVANSLADFVQNKIEFDPTYDEAFMHTQTHGQDAGNNVHGSFGVWTGISDTGDTDNTCNDWTSTDYPSGGYAGYPHKDPICKNPSNNWDMEARICQSKAECENKGFVWDEQIGVNSVGGFASVCDGVNNNGKHFYCISD